MPGANLLYLPGQRVGRERPCGDYNNAVGGYLRHLAADDLYKRVSLDRLCHKGGKPVPVNGERSARGDGCCLGAAHAERA